MAVLAYRKSQQGTEKVWKSSGGDYALTLTSLTNNAAREGAKGDLGDAWDQEWAAILESAVGSAATNGLELELYWGASPTATAGTDNPGNLTGADAALSNPDELKLQTLYVGSLVFSNARGTNVQRQIHKFWPPTRYGTPLIVNKTGQTLSGTAGNHAVRLVPVRDLMQDTA